MSILKNFLKTLLPLGLIRSFQTFKILNFEYGHFRSTNSLSCVDRFGSPIPWYTYPAIKFLNNLDLSNNYIFEFGAGNSTLFWAKRAQKVMSVEDNRKWFDQINQKKPKNVELVFANDPDEYVQMINRYDKNFDVIVIDGSHRFECCIQAVRRLNSGGFIILDNSDWHPAEVNYLRKANLIEVDMEGFGPINGYTWTTSFFLDRQFQVSNHEN